MKSFDVAVIGVGGMGSAACWQLAKAGKRVLGLEQFSIPNTRGSSHGATRILRLGLHESEKYVPLVLRAAELWEETGQLVGQSLFHRIGSLDVAALRFAAEAAPTTVPGPLEILSLAGSLTAAGVHLHMSVSDAAGRVRGGHVGQGNRVRTTAEVLVAWLPAGTLGRAHDPATGYAELVVRLGGAPDPDPDPDLNPTP